MRSIRINSVAIILERLTRELADVNEAAHASQFSTELTPCDVDKTIALIRQNEDLCVALRHTDEFALIDAVGDSYLFLFGTTTVDKFRKYSRNN